MEIIIPPPSELLGLNKIVHVRCLVSLAHSSCTVHETVTATVPASEACPGGFQKDVKVWLRQKILLRHRGLGGSLGGVQGGMRVGGGLQGHSRTLFPRFGGHG